MNDGHSDAPAESTLVATQHWMQQALIFPRRVDKEEVASRLVPSNRLDAASRLAIYQRGYILRLSKCLAEQFPALCHALGQELFDDFAREYLRECPSDSYTLHELGRRFPGYLDEARPDRDLPEEERESWIDFIVDLARYERALFILFDAPGHEGNPWPDPGVPDAKLVLQPCFSLSSYRYPVAEYYHVLRNKPDSPFPPRKPSYVAIARRDYLTSTFPLNPVHFQFLQELQRTSDVSTSLSRVAERVGRPVGDVERSWREEVRTPWVEAGFFIERGSGRQTSGTP